MHKNHNSGLSILRDFPLIIFCTISCPLCNLKTVKDFSIKLGTLIKHDQSMFHAQEP